MTNQNTFQWIRTSPIESLNIEVEEYKHSKTGAKHYHIRSDNDENVFLVALHTVPQDSTGVAHILEHTVLCGSEKYPVRDPFFMMIRRSLNTFMNAFTSSDWTAYPFASKNKKDFHNLLQVYLDSVFFSRIDELDFRQEGHRVEFEEPENPESPLVFKGVVFNEMKGAMSSATSRLWQSLSGHLFPTNTYHFNSGGEPANIPDLSYEELIAFYKKHYHPSNAVFMTFGDIPAAAHQQHFEEYALSRFEPLQIDVEVPNVAPFSKPMRVQESYAIDEEDLDEKTHVVTGWVFGESTNIEEVLSAHLMNGVLLENSASPLRAALETTKLGNAPSPLCGMDDSLKQLVFIAGLEGAKTANADAIESLVLDTLQKVVNEGVEHAKVEAVLHQLELSQREIGGDSYPFGLQLILSAISPVINGVDPVAYLSVDHALKILREKIKDPQYVPKLIQRYLLNNPHRVTLVMEPDPTLSDRESEVEAQRLQQLKNSLTPDETQHVLRQTRALNDRQNAEDDPDILPKVGIEDIPASITQPEGKLGRVGPCKASWYVQRTNGLVYETILMDLPALPTDLVPLLPLYADCIAEVGVGDRDYLETQDWQTAVSGGISAYTSLRSGIQNIDSTSAFFVLSTKSLSSKDFAAADLLNETLDKVHFDETDRIRELVSQIRCQLEQSITGRGHSLAMTAASSQLSQVGALSHLWKGLESIRHIKQLDDSLEGEGLPKLCEDLTRIHQFIADAPRQMLAIGSAEDLEEVRKYYEHRWGARSFSGENTDSFRYDMNPGRTQQGWVTSTQVNFCAKAYAAVASDHPDAPCLTVLGEYLRNGFLHRVIREQGGAYGGGASYDSDSGSFRFYSYRDPRLVETLADFDEAIAWMLKGDHPTRLLEEAILGVVGGMDRPGSPAGEARKAFFGNLHGRTLETQQRFRQRIIDTKVSDLRRVVEQYLQPQTAHTAVVTSASNRELLASLQLTECNL